MTKQEVYQTIGEIRECWNEARKEFPRENTPPDFLLGYALGKWTLLKDPRPEDTKS